MWFDESIIYQIYPLGLCDALKGGTPDEHKILKVIEFIPHIKKLGATCVLFNPLFASDYHGYDTKDFLTVDPRLGTNEDLKTVCKAIKDAGLKIMFDGVFNHVGRGFWAFRDVQEHKWDSAYKDWFKISFDGNSNYNDGFWYEGWEGHFELVKLNTWNGEVRDHIYQVMKNWVSEYDIDGLRLDVAYCLDADFLKALRWYAGQVKEDFVLLGETLHGDYNRWMNDEACHSVTNYECYKGLYSSFNSGNMFEIAHSLNRQFSDEPWSLYTGKHLLSFADNHDVTRVATILSDKKHLKPIYGMVFGMPGVPSIYYGSEWGIEGDKHWGDESLRPSLDKPEWNGLSDFIASLAKAKASSDALNYGSYKNILIQPKQLIFERRTGSERVLVAINADSNEFRAHFDAQCGRATDMITGELHDFGGGSLMEPYSVHFWKCE